MSYLRGPLTKPQIAELMKDRNTTSTQSASLPQPATTSDTDLQQTPTSIDPKITQVYFIDPIASDLSAQFNQVPQAISTNQQIYEPRLMARASITYYDKRLGVDRVENFVTLTSNITSGWDKAVRIPTDQAKFSNNPREPASYKSIPIDFNTFVKIQSLGKSLSDYLAQSSRLKIYSHNDLGVAQKQNEDERTFAIRLRDAARERRDSEIQKIQSDYESKIRKVEEKMKSLNRTIQSGQAEVQARKREEILGAGTAVLGFFMGRKSLSGITTTSRRVRMTEKAQSDVAQTQAKLTDLQKDVDELEAELKQAVDKVTNKWDNVPNEVTSIEVRPKRSDVKIDLLALAWVPIK